MRLHGRGERQLLCGHSLLPSGTPRIWFRKELSLKTYFENVNNCKGLVLSLFSRQVKKNRIKSNTRNKLSLNDITEHLNDKFKK